VFVNFRVSGLASVLFQSFEIVTLKAIDLVVRDWASFVNIAVLNASGRSSIAAELLTLNTPGESDCNG
jgi:hypothetical protein